MKSAFAACLVAAVATAELECVDGYRLVYTYDSSYCLSNDNVSFYCPDGYHFVSTYRGCVKTPDSKFKDLFELNEEGRWQL